MKELIALSFSPWSEKARWALDHHRVEYRYVEYLPMVGEPLLRLRTRRLFGKVHVPVLLIRGEKGEAGGDAGADGEGDRALVDSFDIAKHADQLAARANGKAAARLFPEGATATIEMWNRRSEAALAAVRVLTLRRLSRSAAAKRESLPPFLPLVVRHFATAAAQVGFDFIARKHGANKDTVATAEAVLCDALDALREGLGGRKHLLDRLSYADIAMAVVLQGVEPVADDFVPLGMATRECWRHHQLAERYADLVAWRDGLYADHRA